jgi:hypothetical protein
MSHNSGGLLFFSLADVVFFFGVPAEPSAFATVVDTPAAFFHPPPFLFIGVDEGGGENESLEVLAMRDKSSDNKVGGGLTVG